MTVKTLHVTAMSLIAASSVFQVEYLLLLILGLAFLREAAAQIVPKEGQTFFQEPESCPSVPEGSLKLDMGIISANQRVPLLRNIERRSTSPWNYTVTWDPNRYPSEVVQAQCRHLGCVNAQGKEDIFMNSVPIQQETLVLRRRRQGCSVSFQLEKLLVTVGCTCVKPLIRHVS
ncbi:interleukin-17F [Sapajus apella]|uniref:Interleukin-17F n=1 Tax=Sapajus apella TaxID=9515 RepID=A0A6J3JK81_SAPAP|nr:interleukin-17F [Sapajus apella]